MFICSTFHHLGKQFSFHFEPTAYWIVQSLIHWKMYACEHKNFVSESKITLINIWNWTSFTMLWFNRLH